MRKSGSRVRITAQLINSMTGFHMWSATYDREAVDVLVLQTDIATMVATTLQVAVLGDEKQRLVMGNTLAFEAYMRGRRGHARQDAEGLRAAAKDMDEAIALDPGYANALAFRGWVLDQIAVIAPRGAFLLRTDPDVQHQ